MMHQSQKKAILVGELKVGMIVVGFSVSLILSIKKEKITWINHKGQIRCCFSQDSEETFADYALVFQP